MIYTLTLNPAVDIELRIKQFEFDSVVRANESQTDAGGKGLNVSRMLKNLGTDSVAMGFVGGPNGQRLDAELLRLGIRTDFTLIDSETRTNVSVVDEESGKHIKVNEAGPHISENDMIALFDAVKRNLKAGDWWVLGGSLAPGIPASTYATLIGIINEAGAFTILDASGEALKLGIQAGPTLAKPNEHEAAELLGLETVDIDTSKWLDDLLDAGPKNLVVSLGKQGALVATADAMQRVQSPDIVEQNPIGAGDSLVAGLVSELSQGKELLEALCFGIACGAATASRPGTELGSNELVKDLLKQVTVF